MAHVDLLQASQQIINFTPCKINFTHAKGHQDGGHPTVLSCEAWLNIEVDLLAKKSQIKPTLPDKVASGCHLSIGLLYWK